MGIAPYQRSYRRIQPSHEGSPAVGYLPNPACHLTDQGAAPDFRDLAWCTRRAWRVIHYSARQEAGQPLWQGADDFEAVMLSVLVMLTNGFKPIAPLRAPKVTLREDGPVDVRKDRVYKLSGRVFQAPALDSGVVFVTESLDSSQPEGGFYVVPVL
jgi:hypothetical protein